VGAGLGCATLGSPHHDERIGEFGQKWREATIERRVNLSIQPNGTRWLRNFPARKIDYVVKLAMVLGARNDDGSVACFAIVMLDDQGKVTNRSLGTERIAGYPAQENVGRHFSIFYLREDRACSLLPQALEPAIREAQYETEEWYVRKDGGRF
jgi:PAS domain-containing protein